MYARGMSTRDHRAPARSVRHRSVSGPDLNGDGRRARRKSPPQQRPLDPIYPLVFFDAIRVKIRDEGMVRNKAIHIALGVRADGAKEVIGLWLEQNEGAKFWLRVMNELKNRGTEDRPPAAQLHGLRVLERPQEPLQRTQEIYRAVDADAAEKALAAFEAGPWGLRYPAIGQSWRRAWGEVIPFFAFADDVRRIIYTTDDIDNPDSDFFDSCCVSLFGSGEPVSSSRPTGFPTRACRDAVKAGRCDGATAGCEVSRPRLDGVEHGAILERTEGVGRAATFPCAIFVRHGRPRGKEWCERMRVPPRSRYSRSSFVASVRRFGPRDRQCRTISS
ncbi:transposase [Mesorhizobium sp. M0276]